MFVLGKISATVRDKDIAKPHGLIVGLGAGTCNFAI